MMLNWQTRDIGHVNYLIRRGMFQDLDREQYINDTPGRPVLQEVIHRHSDMGKKEFDLLQQTALKVNHLEKRLNERKPGKQDIKYTIRP